MTVLTPSSGPRDAAPAVAWTDPVARARADLARLDVSREQLLQDLAAVLELAEQARHCPLTGLWTREEWTRQATRMVATGRPVTVLFIDLDGFKAINDSCGHDAGDAILRAVGARLDTWCRDVDGIAARLGGDELVALVPDGCWMHTDRGVPRDELTLPVDHDARQLRFGASIGVAAVAPGPEQTAPQLLSTALNCADKAMYRDKAARRGGKALDRRGRLVTTCGISGAGTGPEEAMRIGSPGPAAVLPAGRRPIADGSAEE